MNNKKRAFLVPVMTLAVCAIAMVGLGFALTTSVTSDSNRAEILTVDLDSTTAGLGNQIDNTDVNKLLNFTIATEKSTTSPTENGNDGSTTVKYTLDKGQTYLKVYSNSTTNTTGKITINFTDNSEIKPTMILTLTNTTNPIDVVTVTVGAPTNNDKVTIGDIYSVQIIQVDNLNFTKDGNKYTCTKTYTNNAPVPTISVGSFGLTFTAETPVPSTS